jgi:hypothetical protein
MRFTQTTTTHNTLVDDDDRTFELMFEPADDPLVGDLPSGDVVVSYLVTDNDCRYASVEGFFADEWCGGEDSSDFWRAFDDGHERNEWIEENLYTCDECGHPLGDHAAGAQGEVCAGFRPKVIWTDRMFWIEKYEHGVVNCAPTGHSSQVDRQWDVAPGVAILTIPDDWCDTDTPEGLFSAASKVCASFTAWCNGWVYGVVHETFRHVEESDGSEHWERVDDEACWGYIGEEFAENVLTGEHADRTGGSK